MGKLDDIGSEGAISRSRATVRIDLAAVTRLRTARDGSRDVEQGSVRGWAVCPEPLARIDVLLNGRFVATARIGEDRPDLAALFPAIPHAKQGGFEAILSSGSLPPQTSDVVLRFRTVAGRSFSITHPLTLMNGATALDHPPIRMAIDDCSVDAHEQLHLSGWALAQAPIAAIQIFVGADHVATTMPGHARPDAAALFPGYANPDRCGFALSRPLPARGTAARATVRVEVVARDGNTCAKTVPARFDPELHRPVRKPSLAAFPQRDQQLRFNCDAIALATSGAVHVEGWATSPIGIVDIAIALDEGLVGKARLGLPRPDVGRTFPRLPGSDRAGFSFDAATSEPLEGAHQLRLIVTLGDGSQQSFIETAVATEAASAQTGGGIDDVMLAVDGMQITAGHAARKIDGPFHLMGWATARAGIASVEVFLDETSLGRAYHGLRREDVAAAFPQFASGLRSGFALSIPARALKQGRRQFKVAVTANDGARAETRFSADITRSSATPTLRGRMSAAELATHQAILAARGPLPTCDLVLRLPPGRTATNDALATLESLISQGYEAWRLWNTRSSSSITCSAAR